MAVSTAMPDVFEPPNVRPPEVICASFVLSNVIVPAALPNPIVSLSEAWIVVVAVPLPSVPVKITSAAVMVMALLLVLTAAPLPTVNVPDPSAFVSALMVSAPELARLLSRVTPLAASRSRVPDPSMPPVWYA